jgi:acetylornithine/succinyldiaminopimelate/putrescine aminotransferase
VSDVTVRVDDEIRRVEDQYASGGVARRPVTIVRGSGARLWDADGKEYIDCAAAHGWASVGHCHPEMVAAICEQAGRLTCHTESSYNDRRAEWYRTLVAALSERFPETHDGSLSRVHACNSGTEAVEAALKFARFRTGRTGFVACQRGFHGRTFGSLSVTATPEYREPFQPLVPDVTHIPFNDPRAVERTVTDQTAGLIIEIIQGEGGVHEASTEFVATARRVCRERGTLLLVDEVQTGFGRTGRWFASEWVDAQPDVLILGKALGGGIPMGAAVWRSGFGTWNPGLHGSTFGGAPLACAASLAALGILHRKGLDAHALELGTAVKAALRGPGVRDVRGRGLMIGVELRTRVQPVLRTLMERGVWALPAGKTVLRLLPPLVITDEEMQRATAIIADTIHAS